MRASQTRNQQRRRPPASPSRLRPRGRSAVRPAALSNLWLEGETKAAQGVSPPRHRLVAVDPPATSLTFWGSVVNLLISPTVTKIQANSGQVMNPFRLPDIGQIDLKTCLPLVSLPHGPTVLFLPKMFSRRLGPEQASLPGQGSAKPLVQAGYTLFKQPPCGFMLKRTRSSCLNQAFPSLIQRETKGEPIK